MSRYSVAFATVIICAAGCSVGGQYGFDKKMVQVPPSSAVGNLTPVAASSRPSSTFSNFIDPFVTQEFDQSYPNPRRRAGCSGTVQPLLADENSAEYEIRDLHGCVLQGSSYWEKLQVSFSVVGTDRREIEVVVDGWLASAMWTPPADSQYTKNMQPEHREALSVFNGQLSGDLRRYLLRDAEK